MTLALATCPSYSHIGDSMPLVLAMTRNPTSPQIL
jgi:hypothetical protein